MKKLLLIFFILGLPFSCFAIGRYNTFGGGGGGGGVVSANIGPNLPTWAVTQNYTPTTSQQGMDIEEITINIRCKVGDWLMDMSGGSVGQVLKITSVGPPIVAQFGTIVGATADSVSATGNVLITAASQAAATDNVIQLKFFNDIAVEVNSSNMHLYVNVSSNADMIVQTIDAKALIVSRNIRTGFLAAARITTAHIYADTQTITVSCTTGGWVHVSPNADYLLGENLNISTANIYDGALLFLTNVNSPNTISFTDSPTSGVAAGAGGLTLRPEGTMTLLYHASEGHWNLQSNPNTVVAAGSGSAIVRATEAITKGQVVYWNGYNAGLNKYLVSLADNDVATERPAAGFAAETVGANKDFTIITDGMLIDVNTAAGSRLDKVYLSNTPGGWTTTKPTTLTPNVLGWIVHSSATVGAIHVNLNDTNIPENISVNGTVTASAFVGDGSALTGISSGGGTATHSIQFVIPGQFAGTATINMLRDYGLTYYEWNYGASTLTGVKIRVRTEDTGANEAEMLFSVNGTNVTTVNVSGAGSAWITTTNFTATDINDGDDVEIGTDAGGSNNDATDLSIQFTATSR